MSPLASNCERAFSCLYASVFQVLFFRFSKAMLLGCESSASGQEKFAPKDRDNAGVACDHFKPPQLNNAATLRPIMMQN